MGIFEKTITPTDCILAIALPLTRNDFFADLQSETRKDYARFYRSQMWGRFSNEDLWNKYEANFVTLVEGVAIEVERLGVKVVRNLKLGDIPYLFSDRDVISLLSHWRGAYIEPEDFIDFYAFVEKLRTSSNEDIALIRQALPSEVVVRLRQFDVSDTDKSSFEKDLIDALNSVLENENLGRNRGFENSPTEQPLRIEQRVYLNRIVLEGAFEGELIKGNRMEFFDGLQSVNAIRDQIPNKFEGLLDLIVCNSVLPAEAIKSLKRNFLIIANQFPAKPSFRLLLYKAIIRTLHNEPDSFINAMTEVRQRLGNYLQTS